MPDIAYIEQTCNGDFVAARMFKNVAQTLVDRLRSTTTTIYSTDDRIAELHRDYEEIVDEAGMQRCIIVTANIR